MSRKPALFLCSLAALVLLVSGCWAPPSAPTYGVVVTSDIVYGQGEVGASGSLVDLRLDLYTPTGTGQTEHPLVVVIHGGGFSSGSKTMSNSVSYAQEFAKRGYLVASIDYRLMGANPVPSARVQNLYNAVLGFGGGAQQVAFVAAVDDTLTALDYLQSLPQVQELNTVLLGSSAGAITAVWVGYGLDDLGIQRPPVRAVVSNWGGFMVAPAANYMDNASQTTTEPYYWEPPIFMAHTTGDPTVPYAQSTAMNAAAAATGIPHTLYTKTSNSHGFDLLTEQFTPGVSVMQAEIDFVNCALYGQPCP